MAAVPQQRYVVPYAPRPQFVPYHERTERWAVLVCHRRFGKTTGGLADMLKRAIEGPADGHYGFIAPYYNQVKGIAWEILKGLTREIVADKPNEAELRVDLIFGPRIRLFGADKPNSLRGYRFDGAHMDEYADFRPQVFPEVIRPALADRGGWGTFSGTPQGPGMFKDLYDDAVVNPRWLALYLPNSVTGVLSPAELADMRMSMSDEVYEQEVECSWDAPRSGSFYGRLLQAADRDGRVGFYPHDPECPVYVAFDIGWRDATAAWFWQPVPGGYNIIDWEEGSGKTVDDWDRTLASKGYDYAKVYLPPDARAKTLQTGKSTVEQLLQKGYPCEVVPALSVQQGIDAARLLLPHCHFHKPTTEGGVRRLWDYRRKWMEQNQAFSNEPLHNEASHTADALRYFAVAAREFQGAERRLVVPVTTPVDRSFKLDALWADHELRGQDRETL